MKSSPSDLAHSGAERHPIVEAFLAERFPGHPDLCLDIAAGDEMFAYALAEQHQHRGLALLSYLRSGLTAWETLEQVLCWRFGELAGVERLLDFASGFGRVTRFLLTRLPAQRVTVGEISHHALAFQAERFGVATLASQPRASQLEIGGPFDAVLVCSLFTHLPDGAFGEWLARLWSALRPGGVLVFSVNGEDVLFPGREMSSEGIYFERVSENEALDSPDYGSTWVSEDYVRQRVESSCPGAGGCFRIERGLWHFQDLYVVTRGRASEAPRITLEPEGYLDTCVQLGPKQLQLAGWAIDRQSPYTPPLIRVLLNGEELARGRASEERGDLAELHGDEFLRSGWVLRCGPPSGVLRPEDRVMVMARSSGGRSTVLHASALEGADLSRRVSGALEEIRAANLHLRARVAELEERIAWMERSRFWKLRNRWFRWKERLRPVPR